MDNAILEVIESYNEYLLKLKNGLPNYINLVKESDTSESKLLLIDLLEGLLWLKNVSVKIESFINSGSQGIQDLNLVIQELGNAAEKGDINYCVEIIDYEVLPLIEFLNPLSENIEN